ncbi:HAD domain-containing protein [Massilia eburnea]|uniref:HAD domain-containing protein n=1 Tax=Massilia eburnea TaxID=1776165 RepID=UPI003D6BC4AF
MTQSPGFTSVGSESRSHPSELDFRPSNVVVYLDFDGVLHCDEVYWSPKTGIYMRTPGRTLFEWMPILEELLAPYPDVKVVLSTSWVRVKGFGYAKKQLTPSLQSRVVGGTFHRREMRKYLFDSMSRGAQVHADVLRRRPRAWFAIDNDDKDWPASCRENLIKTEDRTGLSDPAIQAAICERLALLETTRCPTQST